LCTILPPEKSSITLDLRSEEKELLKPGDMFAIGTQCLYLFFRLHQVLVRRLNIAKKLAYEVSNGDSVHTLVEKITIDTSDYKSVGQKRYEAYLALLYPLVELGYNNTANAAVEGGRYEDRVRSLLGHNAYELATMDKLISHILKNLQNMGNDEVLHDLIELHRRHRDSGSFKPSAFRQEAASLSEGENMFAFQYSNIADTNKSIIHFEFMGCIAENETQEADIEVDSRVKRENPDRGTAGSSEGVGVSHKRQRR